PVLSVACAVQLASVSTVIVYVLFAVGLTTSVSVPVVPVPPTPVCSVVVVPSNHVTFHGPLPVKAAESVAEPPLQIVVEPLTTDVGRAFTVTVALPVLSPARAVQLASVSTVIV